MQIQGVLEKIIFNNKQNGYTVALVKVDGKHITVVGNMPNLNIGELLTFDGEYGTHKTFGEQFAATSVAVAVLEKSDEIYRYLASKAIRGIGPSTAEKIIEAFGDDALNVIADEPQRLANIKGISLKKAIEISEDYARQVGSRDVVMFLQKFGISMASALKIYQQYKTSSINKIKENPYILCNIRGIGFSIADRIALQMELPLDSPQRVYYGIISIMHNAIGQGHVCAPVEAVVRNSSAILGLSEDEIELQLMKIVQSGRLVIREGHVFLLAYDEAESTVARRVKEIISYENDVIDEIHNPSGIELDENQLAAVKLSCKNNFIIITGGPGTGKTTIMRTLIETFESVNLKIELAAPTGRAAKRISEVCNREARTIHRLLEIERMLDDDTQVFMRDQYNPLECDVLIVDEASMLDLQLAASLLRAVRNFTRVIFVGDVDQLPPVGAGDVLRDLIKSEAVPVAFLTEIYRQARESHIVVNAHRVNDGEELDLDSAADFEFVSLNNEYEILSELIKQMEKTQFLDTQVLSPMRKGICGVYNLNLELQSVLNPQNGKKNECKMGGNIFRVGDKVMQIKNNYSMEWKSEGKKGQGVFNGDIGQITHIDTEDEIIYITFDDDKEVAYNSANIAELELAYATTVHKSQGSEYACVMLVIDDIPPMLVNRNLLYTAMTRASDRLVVIGRKSVLNMMIANVHVKKRYSQLADRVQNG